MAWMDFWRRAPASGPVPTASGGDVQDELLFHFRALVDEKMSEGLSFDAAWERAEQQFGPLRRYENECRAVSHESRLAWRMAGALIVAVAVVLGASWASQIPGRRLQDEVRLLRQDVQALRQAQSARIAPLQVGGDVQPPVTAVDLDGVVLDQDNQPLADATVLVILKTWPGGEYQQRAFTAKTRGDGRFQMPGLIPAHARYAVLVAALKEGFAFQSVYERKLEEPIEKPNPITLRLEPASLVTLVVRDGNGRPVPNAHVMPFSRTSPQGTGHLIYFQGSEPVRKITDAEGRVRLNCFVKGDQAEVYVQFPGNEWNSREFEVSADEVVVDMTS